VVSPGVPDGHPIFSAAGDIGLPLLDEYDLAVRWDDRRRCAVTGTNGKTTVVTLIVAMLEQAGVHAAAVANTETPMVAAIDDAETQVFVVEASSFRLAHVHHFSASPSAWLNFSPDHLDVHADLKSYEAAKARIWEGVDSAADAVANLADPVVAAHAPVGATGFGRFDSFCRIHGGRLLHGDNEVIDVASMPRRLPHDLLNAQAATAVAVRCGADLDSCAAVLTDFRGLAHRMNLIAEHDGIRYVDDSKATTPHATLAALAGLPGSVLIAGGRNKGLDLSVLGEANPRCVVAIGEAAGEIEEAFGGRVPLQVADSMATAVEIAGECASGGGTVLLSPGCTSFDWYASYSERGLDFARAVAAMEAGR
jgi:UDP-N-acetylmuramoylalanine--D-glutamate ligase